MTDVPGDAPGPTDDIDDGSADESAVGSPDGSAPRGWYPDPLGEAEWRYFDGTTWLDATFDGPEADAPGEAPGASPAPATAAGRSSPPRSASAPARFGAPTPTAGRSRRALLLGGGALAAVVLVVVAVVALSGGDEPPVRLDAGAVAAADREEGEQPAAPDDEAVAAARAATAAEQEARESAEIAEDQSEASRQQAEVERQVEALVAAAPPVDVEAVSVDPATVQDQLVRLVARVDRKDADAGRCRFVGAWDQPAQTDPAAFRAVDGLFVAASEATGVGCTQFADLDEGDAVALVVRGRGTAPVPSSGGGTALSPAFEVLRVERVTPG